MFAPAPLPRNLEASFRDLASEKPATRASALRDVVRHAMRSDATRARAIPRLEQALRDDPSPAVRGGAAVALADLVARDALPVLLVAVEDDDAYVRQMALTALGEIGDGRAVRRLERAVHDARPEVRYQAVIAFARVARDDAEAVMATLLRALDDDDDAIRYIALRLAEERLAASPTEGRDRPHESEAASPTEGRDRPHESEAESPTDARMRARAEELAKGPDAAVAVVAALYLARVGSPLGRAVVLDVVADRRRTPETEDEQACIEVAGDLCMRDAIPHLEHRAWGPRRFIRSILAWGGGDGASCAWHARVALARMGHPRACREIIADLSSWRRDVREAAVVAAGRARLQDARDALQRLEGSVDTGLVREALVRLALG